MVKEFGNNAEDSSEGGLRRCEDAGPSSTPGRDTRDSSSAVIITIPRKILRKIPSKIPRKTLMGLRPRVGCSPCGLDGWDY